EKKIERALVIYSEFQFSKDLVQEFIRDKFNLFNEDKCFIEAFLIGREFDISTKRILTSAIRGYNKFLIEDKLNDLLNYERKYQILHSEDLVDVSEEDIREFVRSFEGSVIRKLIEQGKIKILTSVTDSLGLFDKYEHNPILSKIIPILLENVTMTHNKFLDESKVTEAFDLTGSFHLLDDTSPLETTTQISEAAEKAHNKKLEEFDIKNAIFLKQKYVLFAKSDSVDTNEKLDTALQQYLIEVLIKEEIDNAKTVIDEYQLKEPLIVKAVSVAILKLLEEEKYQGVCNIVEYLKVKEFEPKAISEITIKFHNVYEKKNMETASDLAFIFNLKESRAKKAHFEYWVSLIQTGDYSKAMAVRKERKIPKEPIETKLKEICKVLRENSQDDTARKLQEDYNLKSSVFDWIIDNIKKMFSGK
ncbi:MAG: hypothetical protein GY863_02390, partial [bacterium]|nr:hypothetical protein [bacterium]